MNQDYRFLGHLDAESQKIANQWKLNYNRRLPSGAGGGFYVPGYHADSRSVDVAQTRLDSMRAEWQRGRRPLNTK